MSSPIIWEGRIFLTEFNRSNKRLATLCIDRRTGKILWRRTVAPEQIEKVHAISSPAAATPATDGERVYVYKEEGGSDGEGDHVAMSFMLISKLVQRDWRP